MTLTTKIKFFFFSLLESFINKIWPNTTSHCELLIENKKTSDQYIWVFATTIGELNAINSFFSLLLKHYPEYNIVLFTDHPHYAESYHKKYPHSIIISHGSSAHNISFYLDKYPAFLFLLAEIPINLYDAPCRFSYRVLYEVKKRSVPVFAVNSWFYKESPPCKMDQIEYNLFHKDYLNCIDLFLVQTDSVQQQLIKQGVNINTIHITGNLKFDSLLTHQHWDIDKAQSSHLLKEIIASKRPCIVAGCVSRPSEQELLLDMYSILKTQIEKPLFVLVPRHPEKKERMLMLKNFLEQRQLSYNFKSTMTSSDNLDFEVLVLDTYGELNDFYAISTINYVGYNHNILEPMRHGQAIVVSNGWNSIYPSYPIYKTLIDQDIIFEAKTVDSLSLSSLIKKILMNSRENQAYSKDLLINLAGAANKNYKIITSYLGDKT